MDNKPFNEHNKNNIINIDEYQDENKLIENALEDEEDRAQRKEELKGKN